MDEGGDPRERLARMIRDRRLKDLKISVRTAATRAGIDRGTWASAESGERRTAEVNLAGIEEALEWEPGSIDAILAGGEPTPRRIMTAGNLVPVPVTADEILAEIERVNALSLPATTRLGMIQILVAAYEETTGQTAPRGLSYDAQAAQ
jgi:hypothetical protein